LAPVTEVSAAALVAALEAAAEPAELPKVRSRLAPDEPAFGLRMKVLFDTAKAHTDLPLDEVERLLGHPAYEPRMAAFCILDFKARRRIDDDLRRSLHDLYLARHDRITTWDMVDRSAPRVVGGYLVGRDLGVLHRLAAAAEPLRRRTAITAPLSIVRSGSDEEVAECLDIAAALADDPDPVVHKSVGIFLKYAGQRDPARLLVFLDAHATRMPRPAVRLATEKLDEAGRGSY
jgi:hypothetical protein